MDRETTEWTDACHLFHYWIIYVLLNSHHMIPFKANDWGMFAYSRSMFSLHSNWRHVDNIRTGLVVSLIMVSLLKQVLCFYFSTLKMGRGRMVDLGLNKNRTVEKALQGQIVELICMFLHFDKNYCLETNVFLEIKSTIVFTHFCTAWKRLFLSWFAVHNAVI